MEINGFNQSFGASIVKNETYKKVVENTKEANACGQTSQTMKFLAAIQAIAGTGKFDTFEIQSKKPRENASSKPDDYFNIYLDGEPYEFNTIHFEPFYGDITELATTCGIIRFAEEFLGANFENSKFASNLNACDAIQKSIEDHNIAIRGLEGKLRAAKDEIANEIQKGLNEIA